MQSNILINAAKHTQKWFFLNDWLCFVLCFTLRGHHSHGPYVWGVSCFLDMIWTLATRKILVCCTGNCVHITTRFGRWHCAEPGFSVMILLFKEDYFGSWNPGFTCDQKFLKGRGVLTNNQLKVDFSLFFSDFLPETAMWEDFLYFIWFGLWF